MGSGECSESSSVDEKMSIKFSRMPAENLHLARIGLGYGYADWKSAPDLRALCSTLHSGFTIARSNSAHVGVAFRLSMPSVE